jgi:hypothetical protein
MSYTVLTHIIASITCNFDRESSYKAQKKMAGYHEYESWNSGCDGWMEWNWFNTMSNDTLWYWWCWILGSATTAKEKGKMAAPVQAYTRQLLTAAAQVQTRVWSCGILWWTKVALGQVFSENFGFPANIHSIGFSTIIFTITRGWHNRPGVVAVPIASQTK